MSYNLLSEVIFLDSIPRVLVLASFPGFFLGSQLFSLARKTREGLGSKVT